MTVLARPKNNRPIIFGIVALMLLAMLAAVGGYWWNDRNQLSQASKADCALAQRIVDEAHELQGDKAAVEKWEQSTIKLRRAQMKDGYLGFRVAQYELWAAMRAKGEGTPPSDNDVRKLADKANGHCADALVTLTFPSLAS